ncbi:AfsR/SARP family transcriptional regulator [Paenibacillus cymbidii]|uniref:AfsR/SARP family transcriptional regulator n=1 Tax=Paenibacillus cymbidii TaxID=1639034 RepID=UPI0014367426|nr:BTAD domain-containing putative transcriptional regulator [Paenibacillus cymbidii]
MTPAYHDSRKRKPETILEAERLLLCRDDRADSIWETLPYDSIAASPLLSGAYGSKLLRAGRLAEAGALLASAIKGLAALQLQAPLLAAMADCALLRLKTGELTEAGTLLRFLADHYERGDDGESGAVPHALAKGALLHGDPQRLDGYVAAAFERYAACRDLASYGELLLDLWTGLVVPEQLHRWEPYASRAEQMMRLQPGPAAADYPAYLLAAEQFQGGNWQEAAARLAALATAPFGSYYAHLARIWHAHAAIRAGRACPSEEWRELERAIAAHAADLELQCRWQLACHARHCFAAIPDASAADDALRRVRTLVSWLPLPPLIRSCAEAERDRQPIAAPPAPERQADSTTAGDDDTEAAGWSVRCFGRLSFERGDCRIGPIPWKRKKTRELLVYLLLQPHYEAPRERIAEALFGDVPFETIAGPLYAAVHQLRRIGRDRLGTDQAVAMKEGMIRLDETIVGYLDVEHYTTLWRVGEQLWHARDRDLAAELFEQAVPLYGELAPEIADADWLHAVREMLQERQATMLQRLVRHASDCGAIEAADAHLAEWLRLRPLQEEAHQAQIARLAGAGRREEAQAWFRKWEQLCEQELAALPLAETRRLAFGAPS